jgi:hypothetical protein
MSLFVAELEHRAIAVFNADDHSDAQDFVDEAAFQDDLQTRSGDGDEAWDGITPIDIRDAGPEEIAIWQIARAEVDRSGDGSEGDLICVWLVAALDGDGRRHLC